MKRQITCALLGAIAASIIPVAVEAEPICYFVNSGGGVQDLSALCGAKQTAKQVSTRPASVGVGVVGVGEAMGLNFGLDRGRSTDRLMLLIAETEKGAYELWYTYRCSNNSARLSRPRFKQDIINKAGKPTRVDLPARLSFTDLLELQPVARNAIAEICGN